MMIEVLKKRLAAALMATLALVPVYGETTETQSLSENIRIGPADENEETSRALMLILRRCAEAYRNTDAMTAEGTVVQATKSDGETTYSSAKVSLAFHRPDKFAVVSESESLGLSAALYADGTTVTHVSGDEKDYVELPQSAALDSYASTWRAGDIFPDYSGAIGISGPAPLLISSNPDQWLHEGVTRYVYEGEDDVAGKACYRVRFNQDDDNSVIIIWIDKTSYFITRVSSISSYDDDYELVESFEEGTNALMRIMTWDHISTKTTAINQDSFVRKIPANYKLRSPETPLEDRESAGFWGELVQLAAKSSPEETTWSLTGLEGAIDLRMEMFAHNEERVLDFEASPATTAGEHWAALGFEDGRVQIRRYDGTLSTTLKLQDSLGMLGAIPDSTSEPLLLVLDKTGTTLDSYDLRGRKIWTYSHPHTTIEFFRTTNDAIYLGLGYQGARKLGATGDVLFANSKIRYIEDYAVSPKNDHPLLLEDMDGVTIMNSRLTVMNRFETDESVKSLLWDDSNASAPVMTLVVTTDRDVLLQRRDIKGDVVSTTMIESKADAYPSASAFWARLRVGDVIETCAMVLLGDGKVLAVSPATGNVIYRGQIKANDVLISLNDNQVINAAAVADVNGDGADEIYFPIHNYVFRLKTEP